MYLMIVYWLAHLSVKADRNQDTTITASHLGVRGYSASEDYLARVCFLQHLMKNRDYFGTVLEGDDEGHPVCSAGP